MESRTWVISKYAQVLQIKFVVRMYAAIDYPPVAVPSVKVIGISFA